MNAWLIENLACPLHRTGLSLRDDTLACAHGCQYPIIDGVPVLLLADKPPTMELAHTSSIPTPERDSYGGLYVESLGLIDEEKRGILRLAEDKSSKIDPAVSFLIGATNGIAYKSLIGKLTEYPIPEIRLPPGDGKVFLDLGCSWGRWCIASARKGYRAVGIDPSLGAVMAAKRVAKQLGVEATYVVGDARFLPFRQSAIDCVFSYSVLQHFSREDAATAVAEIGRTLNDHGTCLIQMPTILGLRCLYHQARRHFRDGTGFEVRYWSLPSLHRLFLSKIGVTHFSVDCFFGIGLQYSDRHLLPPLVRMIVSASEFLRLFSLAFSPLIWVADSVYVSSVKAGVVRQSP